ncbi:MAG: CCA tRNA nucleotidyltransferase [Candidatus Hydrogenedentota bacterium]|uniref:tRNA nucleotidyltransferase n=1 Tax=Sumerlaea chitinivorans TaxID=2250252 RepID=A0A2Z4Y3C0_SUMC1|nr:tRNA nucleotidyltransferase [Candidatus Sumerlaea chitinivorans]RMH27366.1 MAG: CCA tRNA nucleotidyltransferase [Candidatus Hydrogenedentota bacterium]GIX44599.1 MAG: HDIG domain-containing protein [Candidatus Sumerlaea sp.]
MSHNEQLARTVVQALREHGYEAYFVGGCVRDRLLGREPNEFDVATNAPPNVVQGLFPKTVLVGAKFGVVTVVSDCAQVEVATFRSESGYVDHRHPSHVAFGSVEEDAQRRDFTINALYQDPFTGTILDLVGGRSDLQRRLVRAIGRPVERFQEDALRLLRALRFAASLEFTIEPSTWEAICQTRELIQEISAERVRDELVRGFTSPHPDRFLELLDASGLLAILLPEVEAMKGCEQPPEYHPEGDVFTHTKLMLKYLAERNSSPSIALAFAVLLHDVGKPPTAEKCNGRIRFNNHDKVGAELADHICRRLAFPNELRKNVVEMVRRHMTFLNLPNMRESTLRRFLAAPTIEEEIELHRVDCLASHGNLQNADLAESKLRQLVTEGPAALPPPLLNGHDLIALGFTPSPQFKHILRSVQDAQLEGKLQDKQDAIRYVLNTFGKPKANTVDQANQLADEAEKPSTL